MKCVSKTLYHSSGETQGSLNLHNVLSQYDLIVQLQNQCSRPDFDFYIFRRSVLLCVEFKGDLRFDLISIILHGEFVNKRPTIDCCKTVYRALELLPKASLITHLIHLT